MYQRYFLIAATVLGLAVTAPAQTTANTDPTPATVYSGLSTAGDQLRDKGDFTGAINAYNLEINQIDAEARRISKLKADYEKMSEFDKMSANQDEIKKSYSD